MTTEDGGRRTEDRGQRTEDGDQERGHHFSGSAIILPSFRPISSHRESIEFCSVSGIYPLANDVANQCWVSACSPSASESLHTKCALYRRFCHASAIFAPMDREALRNWSVSE